MFTTPEEVMAKTPFTGVTTAEVAQAQLICEIYAGKTEGQVSAAKDKALMARAVIAQTVYMRENSDVSFTQIKVSAQTNGDGGHSYRDDYSPFVAPLAVMAMNHCTWFNSRSVKIGRMFQGRSPVRWDRD